MKNKQKFMCWLHKNARWLIAIAILLLITVLSLLIMLGYTKKDTATGILPPDYAAADDKLIVEEKAESTGEDELNVDKMDQPSGGGAVSLTFTRNVRVDLASRIASLLFENPAKSNQAVAIQVVIQGKLVTHSDLLMPGMKVTELAIEEDAGTFLVAGSYDGAIMAYYYDVESGNRADVYTEIPVTVSVE